MVIQSKFYSVVTVLLWASTPGGEILTSHPVKCCVSPQHHNNILYQQLTTVLLHILTKRVQPNCLLRDQGGILHCWNFNVGVSTLWSGHPDQGLIPGSSKYTKSSV